MRPLNPFEAAKTGARVTLAQATAREVRAATRTKMTDRWATEPLTDNEEDPGTTKAVVEMSPDGSGEIYNIN